MRRKSLRRTEVRLHCNSTIMAHWTRYLTTAALAVITFLPTAAEVTAEEDAGPVRHIVASRDDNDFNTAVKTNLLYNALAVPNLAFEFTFNRNTSLSVSGIWAWWSDDGRHRCWRVYGGDAEFRWWPGNKDYAKTMCGHHIGIYGSFASFDFEFGGRGWQSPDLFGSVGLSYGYSFILSRYFNLDLSLQVGYASGSIKEYRPECGEYLRIKTRNINYFGPTGFGISLVWFPFAKERREDL